MTKRTKVNKRKVYALLQERKVQNRKAHEFGFLFGKEGGT